MSLVERALKKMRDGGQEVAPEANAAVAPIPIGRIVEVGAASASATAGVKPLRVLHIDRTALRTKGLLPPEYQERQIATEYRQIKRSLVAKALGRGAPRLPNGQLVMMASAMPGDGKTFTSINLAISMALERDMSVVLVDADVAKPTISALFGVQSEPGLLDSLRDETVDVESLILPTDVPRLSFLPAGKQSETATELLSSTRMRQIAARLGGRDPNGVVLFDSPPLLLTSESRALSDVVGQIVLVVRASVTPQQAVFDALEHLGEGKAVSLVLNGCSERSAGNYYAQYYGDPSVPDQGGGNASAI